MRRKKKKQEPEQSMIGKIVDLNLEAFKKEIVDQKVAIGVLKNLNLNLQGAYSELSLRKESIMKQIQEGNLSKDNAEVERVLKGLYAEMLKIEEKVVFLTDYTKELTDVG